MTYKVTEEGNVSTVFLNGEIDMDVTDLPEPDSPTTPRVSPRNILKLIPLTASIGFPLFGNLTFKSCMSIKVLLNIFLKLYSFGDYHFEAPNY